MTAMTEQLVEIKDQLVTKTTMRDPKKSPMSLGKDNEDHINIWEYGTTPLGIFLSHGVQKKFIHDIYGNFCSIEAFWKYIQSEERDDRMRTMSSISLRTFSRELTKTRVPNFRYLIMQANYQKIMQYPDMVAEMKTTTLPFDTYYINDTSNVRIRPSYFSWLLVSMEEIRTAIKEDREPDLDFLMVSK